jgi:hypothetical protein
MKQYLLYHIQYHYSRLTYKVKCEVLENAMELMEDDSSLSKWDAIAITLSYQVVKTDFKYQRKY